MPRFLRLWLEFYPQLAAARSAVLNCTCLSHFRPMCCVCLQGDGVKSIIIPGIVGVILGLGVGMLIFYT